MCTDRDKILDKIRKLLELSEHNPNEAEAISAALKAQKLMAENDVTEADLAEGDLLGEVGSWQTDEFFNRKWRGLLATTVASNFRCRAYGKRRGRARSFVFVGYECDAKAAILVYDRLCEIGEDLALDAERRARRDYGTAVGAKNTFLVGFVDGVRSELEKQCQALMLVVPREVDKYLEENVPNLKNESWRVRSAVDMSESGLSAGRDAVRSGRMDGTKASSLIGA